MCDIRELIRSTYTRLSVSLVRSLTLTVLIKAQFPRLTRSRSRSRSRVLRSLLRSCTEEEEEERRSVSSLWSVVVLLRACPVCMCSVSCLSYIYIQFYSACLGHDFTFTKRGVSILLVGSVSMRNL